MLITRGSVVQVHLDPPFYNGAIAQLVERLPCTQEVNGSTPFGSTTTLVKLRVLNKNRYQIETSDLSKITSFCFIQNL